MKWRVFLFFCLWVVTITQIGRAIAGERESAQQDEPFGRVEISFHFERQPIEGSNQFAVWIQNQSGEVVKTVFVTRYVAQGGYQSQLDCLPLWVNRADAPFISQDEVDGFSGATPQTGRQTYVWDGTDRNGNQVPFGRYVFTVEGNRHWGTTIHFRGLILTGGQEVTVNAQSETNQPFDINGSGMLTDVVARYIPVGE